MINQNELVEMLDEAQVEEAPRPFPVIHLHNDDFRRPIEEIKNFEEMMAFFEPTDKVIMNWLLKMRVCNETKSLIAAIEQLQLTVAISHSRVGHMADQIPPTRQDLIDSNELYAQAKAEYSQFKRNYGDKVDIAMCHFRDKVDYFSALEIDGPAPKKNKVADADLLDLINDELNPVEVPFPSEVPALEAPASQVPASDVVKDELAGGSQAIHNDASDVVKDEIISCDGDNNDGEDSDDPAEIPDSLHEYDSITKFSLF